MKISIIAALGTNSGIGLAGKIPWHLKEDLKNFKKLTLGHHLLMGRKTFESIGFILPQRVSLVLSAAHAPLSSSPAASVLKVTSIQEATSFARKQGEKELFVIGGEKVFTECLPLAEKLYLTFVDYSGPADVFFPSLQKKEWHVSEKISFPLEPDQPKAYFEIWQRHQEGLTHEHRQQTPSQDSDQF